MADTDNKPQEIYGVVHAYSPGAMCDWLPAKSRAEADQKLDQRKREYPGAFVDGRIFLAKIVVEAL